MMTIRPIAASALLCALFALPSHAAQTASGAAESIAPAAVTASGAFGTLTSPASPSVSSAPLSTAPSTLTVPMTASASSADSLMQQAIQDAQLRKSGLVPGSQKAIMYQRYSAEVADDPNILSEVKRLMAMPGTRLSASEATELMLHTGLSKLGPEQRLQWLKLQSLAADRATSEQCYGRKQFFIDADTRSLAIGSLSDDEARASLDITLQALRASLTPVPMASIAPVALSHALKMQMQQTATDLQADPASIQRYANTVVDVKAASPTDYCWMIKVAVQATLKLNDADRDVMTLHYLAAQQPASTPVRAAKSRRRAGFLGSDPAMQTF